MMPFLPLGTVYGTLLNFRGEVEAMAAEMNLPPYKAPPQAPVLFIKTANTWSPHGSAIGVPAQVPEVEVGGSIAMVMVAANTVGSYVLVNDLSVPHRSFFRPPVKSKCRDGFLGVGPQPTPVAEAGDPAHFRLTVRINGEIRQQIDYSHLVRSAERLLADVSEFMTLRAGDLLLLGCDTGRPLARVGDRIDLSAPGFASLSNTLVEAGR